MKAQNQLEVHEIYLLLNEAQSGIIGGSLLRFSLDPHSDEAPYPVRREVTVNQGPYRLRSECSVNRAIIKHEGKIVDWLNNLNRLDREREDVQALISLLIREWDRVQGIKATEWQRQSREKTPSRDTVRLSTGSSLLLFKRAKSSYCIQ